MIDDRQRQRGLAEIPANLARNGQHADCVFGGTSPRFAYPIGVSEAVGVELILAGAIFYGRDDVANIIGNAIVHLKASRDRELVEIAGLGSFPLRQVDRRWTTEWMRGVFDDSQKQDIPALPIVPDLVPNMSLPWSATLKPVWKWLRQPWICPIAEYSTAATDLAAAEGSA